MQNARFSGRNLFPGAFIILLLIVSACNKAAQTVTPALPGNEFLTTVELQLTNAADPTDVQLAISTQMSPTTHTYQVDSIYTNLAFMRLKANSTYNGRVIILDETQALSTPSAMRSSPGKTTTCFSLNLPRCWRPILS